MSLAALAGAAGGDGSISGGSLSSDESPQSAALDMADRLRNDASGSLGAGEGFFAGAAVARFFGASAAASLDLFLEALSLDCRAAQRS